jgi:uncharacterized membrane protein
MVRTSLWFVPSLMVVVGVILAIVMLRVDAGHGPEDAVRAWWMNGGDGEDARNLLSTLLTATITMASIAFSVTVVALSLAANTYGSRLIRIFRADLQTQSVLGLFVATIVYCLLVLRSVHGKAPLAEVPHAAVTVGTGLALISVLALLVFIQGVARSIVAEDVIRRVSRELDGTIADFPPMDDAGPPDRVTGDDLPADFDITATRIALPREGYVQAVDFDGLVRWAERHDAVLRLEFAPGDFIVDGDQRVLIHPPPADPKRARSEIDGFIVSGTERTPTQDLEFAIRHLVEIATRALSPGINDPFTAKAVIDRLRGGLSRLMTRQLPSPAVHDGAGRLRLQRVVPTYESILGAAFHQIRQSGASMPSVLLHLLGAIARIAEHTRLDAQRQALAVHARLIRSAGKRAIPEQEDVLDVERSFERVIGVLHVTD